MGDASPTTINPGGSNRPSATSSNRSDQTSSRRNKWSGRKLKWSSGQWSHRSNLGSTNSADEGFDKEKKIPILRVLDGVKDVLVSVELTALWRRHLVYGKPDGKELIGHFTTRYAALTTMTTLMIGTQTGILFSPSQPLDVVRNALKNRSFHELPFWAGICLYVNISISIAALIAILTSWSLISVIGPKNAHVILRSALFLHTSSIPSRLALSSIYLFVITQCLFFGVIADPTVAVPVVIFFFGIFLYLIALYSAAGRILLYSGAIGEERIVERDFEYELTPEELNQLLLHKSYTAKHANIHPREQYRIKYQEQLDVLQEGGSLKLDEFRQRPSHYLGIDYANLDDLFTIPDGEEELRMSTSDDNLDIPMDIESGRVVMTPSPSSGKED